MPVHADIHDIEFIFVDEQDDEASSIGVKGLGEIGIVGTAAAMASAVFHATGRRVRDFPITIDKLLKAKPAQGAKVPVSAGTRQGGRHRFLDAAPLALN